MPEPRVLHADEPPEIGGYRLLGGLGDGGQGSVYLGKDAGGRRVAVKVLHARLMGNDRATRRFLQECVLAGRVAAFCTARVIDSGLADGRPYIVSEYVPGPSLRELVAEEGPRTGGALDRLAVGTVAALGAIHRAGIVHRDFKPANVLCGPDGPRVIDFGIAKGVEAATSASTVVGTPGYMAPEQIAGDPATPASDLFAWAATMAYAATGRSLFAGESIPAVMHRILTEEPDLSGVDEPLRSLLAACLDKRPAARPSAADALSALMEGGLMEGGPAEGGPVLERTLLEGTPFEDAGRRGVGGRGEDGRGEDGHGAFPAEVRTARPGRRHGPRGTSRDDGNPPAGRLRAGNRQVEGLESGDPERDEGLVVSRRGRAVAVGGLAVLVLGGVALGLNWNGSSLGSRSGSASSAAGRGGPDGADVAEAYGPSSGVALRGREAAALAVGEMGGRAVVAVAREGEPVQVWDAATGGRLAAAPEPARGVTSLAFAEVGGAPTVVWAAEDGRVSRWTPTLTPAGPTASPAAGEVSAASAGARGAVRAFTACTSRSPQAAATAAVMAVVGREEGPAVAVGCAGGMVRAWDLLSGRKSGLFFAGEAAITGVAWPGSGSRVVFGTAATHFQIGDLWGHEKAVKVHVDGRVSHVVSRGGLVAASVEGRGGATVYDVTGREVCRVPAQEAPGTAALALTEAGGRALLAGAVTAGGGLRVWDARTCGRVATLLPSGSVTALAAGPLDGSPGLVAAVGGTMRAWTLRAGR
ncbi:MULTISPECIES: WD40 repeat domain-containing serine/threonine-protein kinase [unclassified Nonomuraea]|uniref:WD40 repeat domain-containing serine/threonine protein kinase n=1 Tax=unclassified Nonomuraea TaxID=2593643 RepID=UPI0033F51586